MGRRADAAGSSRPGRTGWRRRRGPGIPQVVAPGCLDMANFGGPETVPEQYRGRNLYEWNPSVTLMRTNVEENAALGRILAEKVNLSTAPVTVFLPLKGVSQLDSPGGEFWWPEADGALLRRDQAPTCAPTSRWSNWTAISTIRRSRTRRRRGCWRFVGATQAQGVGEERCATRGEQVIERLTRSGRPGQTDRRRGRGDGHLRQVRRGGRRGPDHHLQLRPLPHGGARQPGRHPRLRRREPDRQGDGRARGAAGRQGGAGDRRGHGHRPAAPDGLPAQGTGRAWLLRHQQLPDRRPDRRALPHGAGADRTWASARKWT